MTNISLDPIPDIPPVAASQKEVFDYLRRVPSGITFVHGKAGSGKSYLIRELERKVKGCQVLTPTNLAATLYTGARTLHSFFRPGFDNFKNGVQDPRNIDEHKCYQMNRALSGIRMIVIDEISMVRADTLEMIHRLCAGAKENDRPFGGIPIVLVGDMFQLPPVVENDAVFEYLKNEYDGIYFYDSHVIRDNIDHIRLFELTKSYRQTNDPEFVRILDAFRSPLTPEKRIGLLKAINTRVTDSLPKDAVYIASSNDSVNKINLGRLNRLPGDIKSIEARYNVRLLDGSGYLDICHGQLSSSHDIVPIILPSQYDAILNFKEGARVMITKNSKAGGYQNGRIGTILHLRRIGQGNPIVSLNILDEKDIDFRTYFFEILLDDTGTIVYCPNPSDSYLNSQIRDDRFEMIYNPVKHQLHRGNRLQTTYQFPIKPAYAFTIHKSQGQTYSKVILDLNSHIFAPGQLYVALSRAKSLEGLFLTKNITYSDIISDDSIFLFLNKVRLANGATAPSTPYPGTDTGILTDRATDNGILEDPEAPYGATAGFNPDFEASPATVNGSGGDPNPRCDDFLTFVRLNETNTDTKEFICRTLLSYKTVLAFGNTALASEELSKVVDIITRCYVTDRYENLLKSMAGNRASEACSYNLNAIFEIYTDVVRTPRSQPMY